ncbi:MAG: ChrR family anti-sigma-E factor [Alphaproteobacteria bacterium]
MTQPLHHPDPEMLLAFATGALDPALSLVIETHAALCPQCRKDLDTYDAIGGAMLDAADPVDLSDGLAARVMAQLEGVLPAFADMAAGEDAPIDFGAPSDPDLDDLPEALKGIAREAFQQQGWKKTAKGLHILDLCGDLDGPDIHIFRLQPGASAPRHTHRGQECTLVLKGAFRDEVGRYGPGDIAMGSPDLTHRPVAEEDGTCLALSVTTAPVQLTGVMGVIQRALGQ